MSISTILPLGAAIMIGVLFALQPVINATIVRTLGSSIAAAALSVFITLLCLLVLLPFSGGTLRPSVILTLPWWSIGGGLIGVAIVAGATAIAPITGAALLFVLLVTGQLIGASIADHVGAFGLPERPFSTLRFAGLAFVLIGCVLVYRG